jgi:hypothetical protein
VYRETKITREPPPANKIQTLGMYLRRAPRGRRALGKEPATAPAQRAAEKAPPPPRRAGSGLGPSRLEL